MVFWNKKEKVENPENVSNETIKPETSDPNAEQPKTGLFGQKKVKKNKPGSFDGIRDLSKMLFKKRDYKIEIRQITKEDKKAAIITVFIILGLGLLLWFLPFTHQFFEDIIFLRK